MSCQWIIPWRMPNFLPYVVIHCMESVANFTYSLPCASKSWEKKKFPVCSQEVFLGTGANNHRSASQDPFGLAEEIIMEINPELCYGSEPGVFQHSQGCTWKTRSELPEIHRETEKVCISWVPILCLRSITEIPIIFLQAGGEQEGKDLRA